MAIDSIAAPADASAAYWNEQNVWNAFTPLPVRTAAGTSSAAVGARNSTYSQDVYFDTTDAFGSGFQQSLETFQRDAAGRVTKLTRSVKFTATSTYAYRPDGASPRSSTLTAPTTSPTRDRRLDLEPERLPHAALAPSALRTARRAHPHLGVTSTRRTASGARSPRPRSARRSVLVSLPRGADFPIGRADSSSSLPRVGSVQE